MLIGSREALEVKRSKAREERAGGATYLEIGEMFNISATTAVLWCNPAMQEEVRKKQKGYRQKYRSREEIKEKQRAYNRRNRKSTLRNLIVSRLGAGRSSARKHGYIPCESTKESVYRIEVSYTGKCHSCGVDDKTKLHIDHCHKTGRFRGWLCYSCNHTLGSAQENLHVLQAVLSYLKALESKDGNDVSAE